jgi:hypothetical protein
MKNLLSVLVLLTFLSRAQCNYSVIPNEIYYPGQTVSVPASSMILNMYICGPSAVIYDTLDPVSAKYRIVYVSSGSTYHYKYTGTSNGMSLWAKNGSTVVIYPGTNTGSSFSIDKEPGATITNLSTGTVTINNCASITGPSANYCSPTGIAVQTSVDSGTRVWPNPATDRLFIRSTSVGEKTICIINVIGETLCTLNGIQNEELSLSEFPAGMYYLAITSDGLTETKKIMIIR